MRCHRVKREFTTVDSLQFNRVVQRALGIIETITKAERIDAALLFLGAAVLDFTNFNFLWEKLFCEHAIQWTAQLPLPTLSVTFS